MKKKLLKIFIITLAAIVCLSVLSAAAIYFKYKSITADNLQPQFIKSQILPSDEAPLGDVLKAVITISSPWNKPPVSIEAKASQGSQIVGKPEIVKIKNSWSSSIWNVIINVQPYTTGIIPEGTLKLAFAPGNDGKTDFISLKIPEITSLEIKEVSDKPLLASKEEIKPITKSKWFYISIASIVVIIIALLVIWLIFRKKKAHPRILTSWEKAILSLNEIKFEFGKGELQPVKCFLKLTDTIRFYLEERFNLHVPKQTTEEFMSDMENPLSPLNNKDRNFLREFMRSGDMIKFAKYEADKSMVDNSIDRALLLITETIPKIEENKPKNSTI